MKKLRSSTVEKEGSFQVSKWLQVQVLLDLDEMRALFEALNPFSIYSTGRILQRGAEEISQEEFLECYGFYIEALKQGRLPEGGYSSYFSSVFSVTADTLYAVQLEDGRTLVRPCLPVVQLQAHSMAYSQGDGKFRPMILGSSSILWGLQFSYPQIFQNPKTFQIEKVDEGERFVNTAFFKSLQRWLRKHSRATPLLMGSKKINVPMRLGKRAFSWIHQHPQLREQQIGVML